ncbi:2-(3-amino-3-carboxypropyl)histidine synthase subunit 2 [Camellia lanceoleosa]|uniref:2-(3-amino-3-carboxypropyl)histidine synthase subunit 2 n=1 Tax=Camellia lanceoleosa TaxID=1840588 RepID=A0ACC0FAH5_9ERIC|nr:2-(3-amino-3-carboxypropyl)histidine synthase subunit 2 [Camellia lanceoleosa]
MARTHRFPTKTVDLPAQEGKRVTIALAAPSNVYREVGPLKFIPKSPNFYPGEPMCLTNHTDGRESLLLRAPIKNEGLSLLNPSILFPLVAVLASGDAASGIIDPSLPQFISIAAVSSFALGATLNTLVFPQLGRCDVFIYVSCAQTALLDSKEFLSPVITPFEAMIAFNRYC